MSVTYLGELYEDIKRANPMLPVLALGIVKAERRGDTNNAHERRAKFQANYGDEMTGALDICTLYLRMYWRPEEGQP